MQYPHKNSVPTVLILSFYYIHNREHNMTNKQPFRCDQPQRAALILAAF